MRIRTLLPSRPASEIRQRPQGVRRQQRGQNPQRTQRRPARGRRQFAGLRGRRPAPRPRLRLRGPDIHPPAPPEASPDGFVQRQEGIVHLHRPLGHVTHHSGAV